MPEIATQTEFIILNKKEIKKLDIDEREQYLEALEIYKSDKSRKKYNEYMRNYMNTYSRMRYKYDPNFREKRKECRMNYYYRNKPEEEPIEESNQESNNQWIKQFNLLY